MEELSGGERFDKTFSREAMRQDPSILVSTVVRSLFLGGNRLEFAIKIEAMEVDDKSPIQLFIP